MSSSEVEEEDPSGLPDDDELSAADICGEGNDVILMLLPLLKGGFRMF
jgi:hypothetical protein